MTDKQSAYNDGDSNFDGLTEMAIVEGDMFNYSELTSENDKDKALDAEQLSRLCASELVFFNNEIQKFTTN